MVKARMVSTRATLYWNSLAYKLFMVTCIEKRPAEQSFKGTNLESANKNVGHFLSQDSDRF